MSENIDELVDYLKGFHIDAALQRAALVSTSNCKRSLGPDQPQWSERKPEQDRNAKEKGPSETKYYEKKAALVITPDKTSIKVDRCERTPDLIASNFPDINALNNSVIKREIATQCKQSIKLELSALHDRQKSALNQTQLLNNNVMQQERSRRLALKEQNDNLLQQQVEQLAKSELENLQRQINTCRLQTEQELRMISFKGIARFQMKFRVKYERLAKVLMSLDKEAQQSCGSQNEQLRELVQMFDQLIGKIKTGNCGAQELKSAEQFCKKLDEIEGSLQNELKHLSEKAEQELRQKIQQEMKAKEAEEKQRALEEEKRAADALVAATTPSLPVQVPSVIPLESAPTPVAQTVTSTSLTYVHPTRLTFYNDINQFYQQKVDRVKPLQTDESLKKYRTDCQRAINMPLNAISAVSAQHLNLNFEKLYNFFAGQPVKTTDNNSITINDHPLARDYCLLLMAKKFVSQSETAISSNPQAAFPFASVIVTFWKLIPDFGKIYLAYIYKESPYLIPYIMMQTPGQTPEQYLKSIGYRLSERNELEKPDMYLKRQTGIARLYAAVIITSGRKADGPSHPFGIDQAWLLLAHIVMVKPLPDICATIIMEMLQTSGYELLRFYGRQFLKLLLYIQQHYIPQLTMYDEGGPKTRLEMLLSKFLRERQIPQAVGVLPLDFW